jgi:predicted O-methyltransferase YrrM
MVHYDLSHLTQDEKQNVLGPIQDDEALFLYSIIKGMRLNTILEIGGLSGYSATNFIASLDKVNGYVYTVDINNVPKIADNHKVIIKNALYLTPEDVDNKKIDLIFFDCHDMVQLRIYKNLYKNKIITDSTILALHDTNLHYEPYNVWGEYVKEDDGWAHQPVEREMVNFFKELGYDIFNLHTTKNKHSEEFPFRHGVTVCQKFYKLN